MSARLREAAARFARTHGAWVCAWLILGAWFARPLWSATVLPLDDLPNHLARITALHHLGDPRWNLQPYYQRSLGLVPYLGHFYPVHLMTYLFGTVIRANLVYMTLYVFAAPLCGLAFARATGRSRWLAFLLLPLATGIFFQWGFISFCVGSLLVLPACALLYRLLDRDADARASQLRLAVAIALITATLYLCHVAPWGAFGVYAALLLLCELAAGRWRGPLLAAAAMVPSLGLFWSGMRRARAVGYLHSGQVYDAVKDSPAKLLSRAAQLFDLLQAENVDEWVELGLALTLLCLLASDDGREAEPLRKRLRIPLAVVTLTLLVLATPFWIKKPFNWWMINLRFLMPLVAFAIFLPRGQLRGARALLLAVGVALSTLVPLHLARNYRNFSARAEPIIQLLQKTPLGANTLLLHTPSASGNRSFADKVMAPEMAVWREVYNYPLVYRGGFDPYLYDDGFPIRRIAGLAAPKVESALTKIYSHEETKFNADTMLAGWDYFIVKNDYLEAMPPDGVVKVESLGEWSLFHNLLEAPR